MKKTVTLCIANHKGGVGKTTTAVTLGAGLAELGYPVLLVDCDPQSNVARFLNEEDTDGLFDLVIRRLPASILAEPESGHMDCILGGPQTIDVETMLRTSPRYNPRSALREPLSQFSSPNGRPLIIIIDTAPSLSSVQIAALCAADWLLIPATPEFASETGISALSQAVIDLQTQGAGVQLLGILPTMVDPRSREHRETILALRAAFPGLVLSPVRRLIALAEAPRSGQPIWRYAPHSEAAADYGRVLAGVVKRAGL